MDISFYAGDSKSILVTVTDGTNAIDLTGATISFAIVQDGAIKLTKTTVNSGITITGATAGQFTIQLNSSDTVNLSGTYVYYLRVVTSAGNSAIVLTGTVTVTPSLI